MLDLACILAYQKVPSSSKFIFRCFLADSETLIWIHHMDFGKDNWNKIKQSKPMLKDYYNCYKQQNQRSSIGTCKPPAPRLQHHDVDAFFDSLLQQPLQLGRVVATGRRGVQRAKIPPCKTLQRNGTWAQRLPCGQTWVRQQGEDQTWVCHRGEKDESLFMSPERNPFPSKWRRWSLMESSYLLQ